MVLRTFFSVSRFENPVGHSYTVTNLCLAECWWSRSAGWKVDCWKVDSWLVGCFLRLPAPTSQFDSNYSTVQLVGSLANAFWHCTLLAWPQSACNCSRWAWQLLDINRCGCEKCRKRGKGISSRALSKFLQLVLQMVRDIYWLKGVHLLFARNEKGELLLSFAFFQHPNNVIL